MGMEWERCKQITGKRWSFHELKSKIITLGKNTTTRKILELKKTVIWVCDMYRQQHNFFKSIRNEDERMDTERWANWRLQVREDKVWSRNNGHRYKRNTYTRIKMEVALLYDEPVDDNERWNWDPEFLLLPLWFKMRQWGTQEFHYGVEVKFIHLQFTINDGHILTTLMVIYTHKFASSHSNIFITFSFLSWSRLWKGFVVVVTSMTDWYVGYLTKLKKLHNFKWQHVFTFLHPRTSLWYLISSHFH